VQLLGLLERTAGRPSESQTAEAANRTEDLLAQVEIGLGRGGGAARVP
jgi:hypothetical protein